VIHVHTRAEPEPADLALLVGFARSKGAYGSVTMPDGHSSCLTQPVAEPPGYLLPEFDVRIAYQPGDFLQGNSAVNRQLVSRVVDWLSASGTGRVLEGFAGIGNFSLALARRGMNVLALEGSAAMVAQAQANATANGVEAVFRLQDLTRLEAGLLAGHDTLLIDPPRAGAAEFVEAVARSEVHTLLYVSCAAPTLARDAGRLAKAGFQLSRLALVDMLPQTRHIECMALFERL
jgi:23S rRNA (uracil1939-C5)-methyltransferase